MNFVQIAKDAKAAAAECIAEARRHDDDYHIHREIEILALDDNGERCGLGEPVFLAVKDCSGKNMKAAIELALSYEKDATQIGVGGGTDGYESLDDMMKGYDYTPYSNSWDLEDIPVVERQVKYAHKAYVLINPEHDLYMNDNTLVGEQK